MESEVEILGRKRKVSIQPELTEDSKGQLYTCTLDSDTREKHLLRVMKRDASALLIAIDNRIYSILVNERRAGSLVEFTVNGRPVLARIALRRSAAKTGTEGGAASVGELVTSKFSAKVVKVNCRVGDRLQEGDEILVLEAMKMEAQVKTPRDCVVAEVFVDEGGLVERGAKLARLKFL